jgi:hypothetical protein
MDDTDEFANTCPICVTPFTEQDMQFRPCVCALRMCVWCWHRILSSAELDPGRCPNCREAFDVEYVLRQKPQVQRSASSRKAHHSRSALADVTIQDRKLLSVRGLPRGIFEELAPAGMAATDVLQQHFLFGQYGRIVASFACRGGSDGTLNAVVRYASTEAAANALACTHGSVLMGHTLSAALIPTRYCSQFLLVKPCAKKYCWELHEELTDKSLVQKGVSAANLLPLGLVVSCGGSEKSEATSKATMCAVVDNMRRDILRRLLGGGEAILGSAASDVSPPTRPPPAEAGRSPHASSTSASGQSPLLQSVSGVSFVPELTSPGPSSASEAALQQRLVRRYIECNAWASELQMPTTCSSATRSRRRRTDPSSSSSSSQSMGFVLPPAGFPPSAAGLGLPQNVAERKRIQLLFSSPS